MGSCKHMCAALSSFCQLFFHEKGSSWLLAKGALLNLLLCHAGICTAGLPWVLVRSRSANCSALVAPFVCLITLTLQLFLLRKNLSATCQSFSQQLQGQN